MFVPAGAMTVIGPVCALVGTMAWMVVLLLGGTNDAARPLNFTAVAPRKLEPVIVTFVPGKP